MSALSRIEGFIGFMAIALLRAYQVGISPLNPWGCKFHPSCSHYAVAAVRLHGPWLGAWLALKRLGRCRPGTFGGIDPVPEPEEMNGDTTGAHRRVDHLSYPRGRRPLPNGVVRTFQKTAGNFRERDCLEGAFGPAQTSRGQSNPALRTERASRQVRELSPNSTRGRTA